jgi:hypothetical protein
MVMDTSNFIEMFNSSYTHHSSALENIKVYGLPVNYAEGVEFYPRAITDVTGDGVRLASWAKRTFTQVFYETMNSVFGSIAHKIGEGGYASFAGNNEYFDISLGDDGNPYFSYNISVTFNIRGMRIEVPFSDTVYLGSFIDPTYVDQYIPYLENTVRQHIMNMFSGTH